MTADASEAKESLWILVWAPLAWAAHLLLSYGTAAIWCAKFAAANDSLFTVRAAIGVYTALSLGFILWVGVLGWRRHNLGRAPLPHDGDSAASRRRFLGFAALLLAGLSAVAVVYQTLPALFIRSCQ